ncbi:cora-like Mg2+ transporter protein-domain-containing protein [Suillus lakei]|nr:cora-like Mg2+ transporter protein-domain-containing protein [Suillus lakei]
MSVNNRGSVSFPAGLRSAPRGTTGDRTMPPAIPTPIYRHAAPSGPWPWMDFDTDSDLTLNCDNTPISPGAAGQSWRGYPETLFGNWKPDQVKRSKMLSNCSELDRCLVHWLDVLTNGTFTTLDEEGRDQTSRITPERINEFWELLQTPRPANIRVRALFVDNLSLSVLQMLGTRYNIEPFFFSSSLNWIPSHYQEEVRPGKGDHITIVLPFMRTMQNPVTRPPTPTGETPNSIRSIPLQHVSTDEHQVIDTQAPLSLSCGNILLLDLLAIHMVRSEDSSTIISYHPSSSWRRPSPKRLHSLVYRAGQSVYWQKIFAQSKDPTFLFLAILWYALYSWDQAFESLYTHINWLESQVLLTNNINLTRKLHIIQAHLLHYQSLLQDFQKSVDFLHNTPNPAMDSDNYSPSERKNSKELMAKECANLLSEIERLENRRLMQSSRLKNVMDLAFATATVRDSGAMKQISYLTMIFLPASFTATVFGMNVNEITGQSGQETLIRYVAVALALTCFTSWLVVACHSQRPLCH